MMGAHRSPDICSGLVSSHKILLTTENSAVLFPELIAAPSVVICPCWKAAVMSPNTSRAQAKCRAQ